MKNREDLIDATSGSSQNGLKIQMNTFDYYQSPPTVFDRDQPPNHNDYTYFHVPVMRIFGSLTTGHRVVAHVHGVFPYLYVPYDNQDCFKFHLSIERAVAQSLKRNKPKERSEAEEDGKILKYVANVSICKGVPFYGYHVGYRAFYKISVLNPSYLKRITELLRAGNIGKAYDVYESHISFNLQFLTDFNLFGCGWVKVTDLFIRIPILLDEDRTTDELVDLLTGFRTTDVERIGVSDLEFDILAQNIANRLELNQRELHSDFIEKFQSSISSNTMYIQSTKELWRDGDYQRKIMSQEPYSSPSSVPRVNPEQTWVESETNKSMFDYVKGLGLPKDVDLNFNSFVKLNLPLEEVNTAFEAFGELFHFPEFDADVEEVKDTSAVDIGGSNGEVNDLNDDDMDFVPAEDNLKLWYSGNDSPFIEDDLPLNEDDEDDAEKDIFDLIAKETDTNNTNGSFSDVQLTQQLNTKFNLKRNFTQAFVSQRQSLAPGFHLKKVDHVAKSYIYDRIPPEVLDFEEEGLPKIQYDDPFYMEEPPKPFIHGVKKFRLESRKLEYLKPADIDGVSFATPSRSKTLFQNLKSSKSFKTWKYSIQPPSWDEIKMETVEIPPSFKLGFTQKFKFNTQKRLERRPDGFIPLRLLIMELFVPTRGDFKADPGKDQIRAVFWKLIDGSDIKEGILIINPIQSIPDIEIEKFEEEYDMIDRFLDLTRQLDPDLLAGYEVHSSSWGYLIERGKKHDIEVMKDLSRVTSKGNNKFGDHWGSTHTSGIQITGRHVLNIWRHLRDLKLGRHNIEHVTFHLLHERIPHFTEKSLTLMYQGRGFTNVLNHFIRLVDIDARLIETADVINRAAEEARLIGIDFYDVYYRGSQYKVESLMIRIAKAENFILFSPSKKQVRKQKPLECIPLVMEPVAAYYKSPLVVLDFQSLYPSIMIAYNYCYSTLLGSLRNYKPGQFNDIATTKVKHPPGLLKLLEDDITLSPNGLMFAKSSIRKSLLAKMLEDLLDTRMMVKSTMKFLDETMQRLYNNRQLALKLTANVTYGYTSASFSGRMPCSVIADAIVQTGRETLENAIKLIEDNSTWGAKVVYGDTDSLFVYLPGKSRNEAFDIGNEIARQVTENNPDPVTLKFEKVYHPSVLMAKKRYVGYSYEKLNDSPKFDAKGIETVRRDGHPAQQYIVEKSLRILFETNNMTSLKEYLVGQFYKILYNNVSIQDFCFAKDVKLGHYKNPPPGAIVSMKKMEADARAEPQYRERVPYVIVKKPGKILRERATSPEDFMKFNHTLDSKYYIEKTLIPPLERIFNLMGVDIRQYYNDMPKKLNKNLLIFSADNCLICGELTNTKLCSSCMKNELKAMVNLRMKMKDAELRLKRTLLTCSQCCDGYIECESFDCTNYFERELNTKNLAEHDDIKRKLDW